MKPIIVTWANQSWVVDVELGKSFICTKLGYYVCDLISRKDIKLIARPKKTNR